MPVVVDDVDGLASFVGCRVAYLPTSYLGLPLGAPFKKLFGIRLLRGLRVGWQGGRGNTCQRGVG